VLRLYYLTDQAFSRAAIALRTSWATWSPGWRFTDADVAITAASFDNPDWAEVTVHSYRHRWGHAEGDARYNALERRQTLGPILVVLLEVPGGQRLEQRVLLRPQRLLLQQQGAEQFALVGDPCIERSCVRLMKLFCSARIPSRFRGYHNETDGKCLGNRALRQVPALSARPTVSAVARYVTRMRENRDVAADYFH
jgi:hypothetical protein